MSLLTQGQKEKIENIRGERKRLEGKLQVEFHNDVCFLLAIIDNLSKRVPKKYTENELYEIWREANTHEAGNTDGSCDGALWMVRPFSRSTRLNPQRRAGCLI